MPTLSGIVKMATPGEDIYRVKILRLRHTTPSAIPSMLLYSRCNRIPPTVIKDCSVFRILGGRPKVYFVCRVEGKDLVLMQESQNDDW